MTETSWIGHSLNKRYQIESLLGQGGMSAVYKATDPNLRRTVAIKLIHSHLSSDQAFLQRFEEEAAAVASLRHPNIVQVFDFNSDEGTHYMVLEFVQGETLEDRLDRLGKLGQRLPFDEVLRYSLNICDALGYAHQRGMIHRDIKPANIMINPEGQAILMDFGIVKILGSSSHTVTGALVGTANYISPEIVKGEKADQRSDLYSLGIMLFEMLSGKVPFHSDSALTLMMMHVNSPVPDPRLIRPDLPPAFVKILYKCLEKDPDQRYQNAGELAADLKQILVEIEIKSADKTVELRPPSPEELRAQAVAPAQPSASTAQKKASPPWLGKLALGLLIFIVIVAIGGGLLLWRRQAQRSARPSQESISALATNIPKTAAPTATALGTPTPQPTSSPRSTSTPADDKAAYGPAATSLPGLAPSPTTDPNLTPSASAFLAKITGISQVGGKYVVQYDISGFVPKLPDGLHVHFYFNNVAPEDAGMPGAGPWKMYGGPQPFTGYSASQRPEGVTQLCVIVANPDHTVIQGSGNCFDLP